MDISTSLKACPSEDVPGPIQTRQQNNCFGKPCDDCLATSGCSFCEYYTQTVEITAATCLPNDQRYYCVSSGYAPSGSNGALVNYCPVTPPVGPGVVVYFYLTGHPSPNDITQFIAQAMTDINEPQIQIPQNDIIILVYISLGNGTTVGKRDLAGYGLDERQAAQADTIAAVTGTTPDPNRYSQTDFDKDLASLATRGVPGLTIVSAGTRGTPSQTLSGSTSSNSGGNDVVSRGALAGIIIACIIFGALVTALIIYLIYRRSRGYAAPFRSPAASYRP